MAFNGSLLRLGGTDVPISFISPSSYRVVPNQMLDLSAERDTTGVLHRDVVDHAPTKIEFSTPCLYDTEAEQLNAIVTGAFTEEKSRTLTVEYYVPSSNSYKSGTFYVPDVEYAIRHIDDSNNKILFEPLRFAFIEY